MSFHKFSSLWTLFLILTSFSGYMSCESVVYVSSSGISVDPCGLQKGNPCSSVSVALSVNKDAQKVSLENGSIVDEHITIESFPFFYKYFLFTFLPFFNFRTS